MSIRRLRYSFLPLPTSPFPPPPFIPPPGPCFWTKKRPEHLFLPLSKYHTTPSPPPVLPPPSPPPGPSSTLPPSRSFLHPPPPPSLSPPPPLPVPPPPPPPPGPSSPLPPLPVLPPPPPPPGPSSPLPLDQVWWGQHERAMLLPSLYNDTRDCLNYSSFLHLPTYLPYPLPIYQVWWGQHERAMLLPLLYNDTQDRTALIQSEFATIQSALTHHPHLHSFLPNLTYDQFCHAYSLVCSRAWGIEALGNLALVPYADMINHNPHSHTLLCYDEEQQAVEIIADRDYEPGEQVLVSYGDLSSGVLALDFGFTVPDNPHDSVELCVLVASSTTPHDTQLNEAKRRLLGEAQLLPCDSARGACFVLK
ncbi:unnamed protein product [Closterium sp. NIES-64]|nr:unnamed protein product [Closterium sp. NIES-64]